MATPPLVPPPVSRSGPTKVIVHLETTEVKARLTSNVDYTFWTFGGTVPDPMIRVRVGDTAQIRLKNAKRSDYWHSIDLHAVNGSGGGAGFAQVEPGGEKAFEWRALNPGLCGSPNRNVHQPRIRTRGAGDPDSPLRSPSLTPRCPPT